MFHATCTCTCPPYCKCYMCKHIIGVCLRMKIATQALPTAAKAIELGRKRKRGRPAHALLALQRPKFIFTAIESDEEEVDDVEPSTLAHTSTDIVESTTTIVQASSFDDDEFSALESALGINTVIATPDSNFSLQPLSSLPPKPTTAPITASLPKKRMGRPKGSLNKVPSKAKDDD